MQRDVAQRDITTYFRPSRRLPVCSADKIFMTTLMRSIWRIYARYRRCCIYAVDTLRCAKVCLSTLCAAFATAAHAVQFSTATAARCPPSFLLIGGTRRRRLMQMSLSRRCPPRAASAAARATTSCRFVPMPDCHHPRISDPSSILLRETARRYAAVAHMPRPTDARRQIALTEFTLS